MAMIIGCVFLLLMLGLITFFRIPFILKNFLSALELSCVDPLLRSQKFGIWYGDGRVEIFLLTLTSVLLFVLGDPFTSL